MHIMEKFGQKVKKAKAQLSIFQSRVFNDFYGMPVDLFMINAL